MRATAIRREREAAQIGKCRTHIARGPQLEQAARLYTVRTAGRDLTATLKVQRELIARGHYQPLGYLWWLNYELAAGGRYAAREAVPIGAQVNWRMTEEVARSGKAPMLALAKRSGSDPVQMYCGGDLLIIGDVYPLPDIPDPNHVPQDASDRPPMIQQSLSERASGVWENFAVIHPIHQVIFRPFNAFAFGNIRSTAGNDGSHLALLIDPEKRTGHFFGGKLHLGLAGG